MSTMGTSQAARRLALVPSTASMVCCCAFTATSSKSTAAPSAWSLPSPTTRPGTVLRRHSTLPAAVMLANACEHCTHAGCCRRSPLAETHASRLSATASTAWRTFRSPWRESVSASCCNSASRLARWLRCHQSRGLHQIAARASASQTSTPRRTSCAGSLVHDAPSLNAASLHHVSLQPASIALTSSCSWNAVRASGTVLPRHTSSLSSQYARSGASSVTPQSH
mmetsp:Transcript_19042/g.59275  ORF Transcript_19042/g.59275 Transcript_19042/m.59275 type:complete len:224 (+) Transcript_19042:1119-1790(+)